MKKKKETLRTLRCWKCNFKTKKRFKFPAEDLDSKCPKCGTFPMLAKMRLVCFGEGCKEFTIVEGDPQWHNWNFRNKKFGTIDIRNQVFACDDHTTVLKRNLLDDKKKEKV